MFKHLDPPLRTPETRLINKLGGLQQLQRLRVHQPTPAALDDLRLRYLKSLLLYLRQRFLAEEEAQRGLGAVEPEGSVNYGYMGII